jgi:hypothetical protein
MGRKSAALGLRFGAGLMFAAMLTVHEKSTLPDPDSFDDPKRLQAFLDAWFRVPVPR